MQTKQPHPSQWRRPGPALLAGIFLLAATWSPATAAQSLTDEDITNAVDDQLIEDTAVPSAYLGVTTSEGIVTLTGSVNNILAKDRAESLARTVKGVRGVVNRVDVSPGYRPDMEIQEDVVDALVWDPATKSWEIDTKVNNGVVTLSGKVDSWHEKMLAAKVAKGVRGVKGVDNDILLDYGADRADADIQEDIEEMLHWDAYVDDALINVRLDDGKVTLSGTVGSLAEKERATGLAWVSGVTAVDNSDLQVRWWARDDRLRSKKYVPKSESAIKQAVQDVLLYDPRVESFQIEVEPDGGYVTLRGKVDNLKAKRAAAADARTVVGVWAVDNKIKFSPRASSDRRIEDNVEKALVRDPYIDRYELVVSVTDGVVNLYGDVDSTFEKSQADDVASRQVGVQGVNNYLTVNNPNGMAYSPYADDWYLYDYDWYTDTDRTTTKSDWQIEEDIEDELWWSPFVDSDDITVSVEAGVATLTGTVETWGERQAATENAIEGGAMLVDNNLTIEYGPDYYNR